MAARYMGDMMRNLRSRNNNETISDRTRSRNKRRRNN